jgi:hypothetical protein
MDDAKNDRSTLRNPRARVGHNRPAGIDKEAEAALVEARKLADEAFEKYPITDPHLRVVARELALADEAVRQGEDPAGAMIWRLGIMVNYFDAVLPPPMRHLILPLRRHCMVLEDIAAGSVALLPELRPLTPDDGGSPARPADARRRAIGAHYVVALTTDRLFTPAEAADAVVEAFGHAGIRISRGTLLGYHRAALARQPDLRPPGKAAAPPGDGSALMLFDGLQDSLRAGLPARWDTRAVRLEWLRRTSKKVLGAILLTQGGG